MVFAYKSSILIGISSLAQRWSRSKPILNLKHGKHYIIWSTPRTTFLTLTDSTGFHHACFWTVLVFVKAVNFLCFHVQTHLP